MLMMLMDKDIISLRQCQASQKISVQAVLHPFYVKDDLNIFTYETNYCSHWYHPINLPEKINNTSMMGT